MQICWFVWIDPREDQGGERSHDGWLSRGERTLGTGKTSVTGAIEKCECLKMEMCENANATEMIRYLMEGL